MARSLACAGASAIPRQVIALATVRVGKVIGEQDIGGLLKLAERAREGVVGVPIVEARPLEDQMGLARIDTVRRSQNHLPQLGGQMDFFAFLACCACACCACACCACACCAWRIQEEIGLVLLLLVDRVVEGGTDVEREVNLGGGHFALSVSLSVCLVVRKEVLMVGFEKSISILRGAYAPASYASPSRERGCPTFEKALRGGALHPAQQSSPPSSTELSTQLNRALHATQQSSPDLAPTQQWRGLKGAAAPLRQPPFL